MENIDFNNNKFKSIRMYRNKTIKELSKESCISEDEILSFEEGIKSPHLEHIMRICNVLNCQRNDLKGNDKLDIINNNIYFRNQSYINKKQELSYVQKCIMVYRIYNFMENYFKLPVLNKPKVNMLNYKIEDVAKNLRKEYKIKSGPVHMVSVLESNGFIVCNVNPGKEKVEAFGQVLTLKERTAYILSIGNDKKSAAKRNYDLAHELGHFMLHENIDMSKLDKKEFNKIEEEAIDFVCEFLLPKEDFYEDLINPNDLEFYIELKGKYVLPMWVLIRRAYQLGAISHRKQEYLLKEMKDRGWDKKEPLDDTIKISNPTLIKRCCELLLENKIMTESSIVSNLQSTGIFVDAGEIEFLIGLKKGKLSNGKNSKNTNVVTLKGKK